MKFNRSAPLKGLLVAGFVFSFSVSGVAAAHMQSMSPELKHDMADMYAKMGECMKTDKTMEQCQTELMKDCPVMKKTKHCPIMEGMKPMMGNGKMEGMDMGKKMKGMGMDMGKEKMKQGMDMGN